jgi:hypothetical protein
LLVLYFAWPSAKAVCVLCGEKANHRDTENTEISIKESA